MSEKKTHIIRKADRPAKLLAALTALAALAGLVGFGSPVKAQAGSAQDSNRPLMTKTAAVAGQTVSTRAKPIVSGGRAGQPAGQTPSAKSSVRSQRGGRQAKGSAVARPRSVGQVPPQILPGQTIQVGNAAYSDSDARQKSNYNYDSTDPAHPVDGTEGRLTFSDYMENTFGAAVFKAPLSARKAFSIDYHFTIAVKGGVGDLRWFFGGKSLGLVLAPTSPQALADHLMQPSSEGSNLGIAGIPNADFIGRDLYYVPGADKDGVPAGGWSEGGAETIVVRKTDGSGRLVPADYPAGARDDAGGQAWAQAPDNEYYCSPSGCRNDHTPSSETAKLSLSWSPDAVNTAPVGMTSGTISLTLTPERVVKGQQEAVTITTTTALDDVMSLAFIGESGDKAALLDYDMADSTLTADRATAPVTVEYRTQWSAAPVAQSTIVADIGDEITMQGGTSAFDPDGACSGEQPAALCHSYVFSVPAEAGIEPLDGYRYSDPVSPPRLVVQDQRGMGKPAQAGSVKSKPQKNKSQKGSAPGKNRSAVNKTGNRAATKASSRTLTGSPAAASVEGNVIPLIFNGLSQTVYWNYSQAFPQHGRPPTWPRDPAPLPGATGQTITAPSLPAAPDGYFYSAVRHAGKDYYVTRPAGADPYPAGSAGPYDTIDQALAAAITAAGADGRPGTMDPASQSAQPADGDDAAAGQAKDNSFTILIEAQQLTATFTYQWAPGTPGFDGTPGQLQADLPPSVSINGYVGDPLSSPDISLAGYHSDLQADLTLDTPLRGYTASVIAPNGLTYGLGRSRDQAMKDAQRGWGVFDSDQSGKSVVLVRDSTKGTVNSRTLTTDQAAAVTDILQALSAVFGFQADGHNDYTVQLSAQPLQQEWGLAYADSRLLPGDLSNGSLPLDVSQALRPKTGQALADLTDQWVDDLPLNTHIVGYIYQGESKIYSSFKDLQAAHPTVVPRLKASRVSDLDVTDSNITVVVDFSLQPTLPFTGGPGYWWAVALAGGLGGLALLLGRRQHSARPGRHRHSSARHH